jgi:hypothetical protein
MKARTAGVLLFLAVLGGILPWLASFGSISFLETHPGLPLLLGQSLIMPVIAMASWLVARHFWPEFSRLSALAIIAGMWLVPDVWMLLKTSPPQTHPNSPLDIASFLAAGPVILSVYMLNSIGLLLAVLSLTLVAAWPRPKISHGA